MFDLNRSIKNWNENLRNNESLNRSDISELQSHLEDTMEGLEEKGLSQEEAFWVARHRIGDAGALSTEYAKVNLADIWKKRILWILSGYFLIKLFMNVVELSFMSLYLFDFQLTLFKTPLKNFLFTSIPLYFLFLIITGGTLFLLTRKKSNPEKKITHRFRLSIENIKGNKLIFTILGSYLISVIIHSVSVLLLSRLSNPELFGLAAASGNIFSYLWHFFLFAVVIIFAFQLFHKKKKYEIA